MANNRYFGNIYKNVASPLGETPGHHGIEGIRRLAPSGFPVHVAVHHVSVGEGEVCRAYAVHHVHPEHDEINILISDSALCYRVTFDDESYDVEAPATLWIPAGVEHSANVLSGAGIFVCLRIDKGAQQASVCDGHHRLLL